MIPYTLFLAINNGSQWNYFKKWKQNEAWVIISRTSVLVVKRQRMKRKEMKPTRKNYDKNTKGKRDTVYSIRENNSRRKITLEIIKLYLNYPDM